MQEEDASQLSAARTSVILANGGLVMLSTQCCSYFLGAFMGLVLGLIGLWLAFQQKDEELGPATRAYNNVGLIVGGVTSVVGAAFSLFWAVYMGLYVLMFVAMFAGAL